MFILGELDIAYKEFELGLTRESHEVKTLCDKTSIFIESCDDIAVCESTQDGIITRLKEKFKKIIQKIKEFLFGKKVEEAKKQIDGMIKENPECGNVTIEVADSTEVSNRFKKLTNAFKTGKNFAKEHAAFMALLGVGAGVAVGAGVSKHKKTVKTKKIKAKDSTKYMMSRRQELKFVEQAYADMDFDRIIRNHSISDEQRRAAILNKRLSKNTQFDPKDLSLINQYFDAVGAFGEFLNTSTLSCLKFTIAEMKNIDRKTKNGDFGPYTISKDIKNARDEVVRTNIRKIEKRSHDIPMKIAGEAIDKRIDIRRKLGSDIKNVKKVNNITDLTNPLIRKARADIDAVIADENSKFNRFNKNNAAYHNKYKR